MEIKTIPLGMIQANCYCVSGEEGAVVIDPGYSSEEVAKFLKQNREKECLILLTHGHFDHVAGAPHLREETNVPIAIGKNDAVMLRNNEYNLSTRFGAEYTPFDADRLLSDGEEFQLGDLSVRVIETPGHTMGGVCYLMGGVLFSGDTLFCESIGRTDHPYADTATLLQSVRKLYSLPDETLVYPGHGTTTTIEHEKNWNPFVRKNG